MKYVFICFLSCITCFVFIIVTLFVIFIFWSVAWLVSRWLTLFGFFLGSQPSQLSFSLELLLSDKSTKPNKSYKSHPFILFQHSQTQRAFAMELTVFFLCKLQKRGSTAGQILFFGFGLQEVSQNAKLLLHQKMYVKVGVPSIRYTNLVSFMTILDGGTYSRLI